MVISPSFSKLAGENIKQCRLLLKTSIFFLGRRGVRGS
jgi:hypothetical protein